MSRARDRHRESGTLQCTCKQITNNSLALCVDIILISILCFICCSRVILATNFNSWLLFVHLCVRQVQWHFSLWVRKQINKRHCHWLLESKLLHDDKQQQNKASIEDKVACSFICFVKTNNNNKEMSTRLLTYINKSATIYWTHISKTIKQTRLKLPVEVVVVGAPVCCESQRRWKSRCWCCSNGSCNGSCSCC